MITFELYTQFAKATTAEELKAVHQKAAQEIRNIKAEKADVLKRFSGVHGRFQASQLDVLDIREQKAVAFFDKVSAKRAAVRG